MNLGLRCGQREQKEKLKELYWDKGLSTCQIAKLFNVTDRTISRIMHRHEIPLRDKSQRALGIRGSQWKGGRFQNSFGYVLRTVSPNDFFAPMRRRDGSVLEHRLVMAQNLGRCLQRWEIVHHKNHIRDDNRIENLQLVSDDRHTQICILEKRIKVLEGRLNSLEAENTLLRKGSLI